jgi:hypothetical protein
MASEDFIVWQSQAPYGPSLKVGEMGETLLDQFGSKAARYEAKIDFIAHWLGTKNVAELERIATALYVDEEEGFTGRSRASRIMELKPHVDEAQSRAAIDELDQMKAALHNAELT